MAVRFNEAGDHYQVASSAARNFPASDWVIALWTRINDNAGRHFKYALSTGGIGENGSLNIYLRESEISDPNKWKVNFTDDTGTNLVLNSNTSPGADSLNRLILVQRSRSANRVELWFCQFGRDPVLEATADAQSLGALTGQKNLWIGGRADGNADRFLGGVIGEVFRGDFVLSPEQIKALGQGLPPWALGRKLSFYLPLSDARSVQRDRFGKADASATGPGIIAANFPVVATTGTAPKWTPPEPPPGADLLVDESDASTATLPVWDDSQGTVYLEDGNGNKRAVSWSPAGFTVVNNGGTLEQYPPAWNDPPHTLATTYYVKNGGNDSADGQSDANAWATIAKVNSISLQPGDEVLFKRGSTWNTATGARLVLRNGSDANVIKYGNYGSRALPIFDGQGTKAIGIVGWGATSNIWIDGIDVYRHAGTANLYLEGTSSSPPANVKNITIENCISRNATSSGIQVCSSAGNSDNVRIRNCVCHNNAYHGIHFVGPSYNDDKHHNAVVTGNETYGNGSSASGNTEEMHLQSALVDSQIYGNTIHEGRGTNLYWNRDGKEVNNTRIHDNLFYGPSDITGWASMLCKSTSRIYRNKCFGTTHNHAFDIDSAQGKDQTLDVHHNVIIAGRLTGLNVYGPDGDEISGGSFDVSSWNNTLNYNATNSTQEGNYAGAICWAIAETPNPSAESRRALNNLVTNSQNRFFSIYSSSFGTADVDYNYYYNSPNKSNPFYYNGTEYNFSNWQGFGFDTNGTNGSDPLYNSDTLLPSTADYGLGASSPARNKGTAAVYYVDTDPNSWIGINYIPHATSPDAGAYQYLSGKTLEFSKYFLGLKCLNGKATRLKLWSSTKKDNELSDLAK